MVQVTELLAAQPDITELPERESTAPKGRPPKGKAKGQGKRKRASPSNSDQQAKGEKKAKAAAEARTDAQGKTVRYSASPSMKTKERIQRALPSQ